MLYQFQFRPYRRRFRQPVVTSHGRWMVREGVILRLVDEVGRVGWGEIAPIAWFGSETVEQALAFCQQLPSVLSRAMIFSIPDALPSCQFGFESAWEGMSGETIAKLAPQRRGGAESAAAFVAESWVCQTQNSNGAAQNSIIAVPNSNDAVLNSKGVVLSSNGAVQNSNGTVPNSNDAVPNSTITVPSLNVAVPHPTPDTRHPTPDTRHPTPHTLPHSALLPAGNAALSAWKRLWEQGFRTFKWKIGVGTIAEELASFDGLVRSLPASAKLRLDANGGLSVDEATQWLETCDAIAADPSLSVVIEYLEQPLKVSEFQAMQALSERYTTPIALDESVATLQQLEACYRNGWRGVFVIKPAIVGSPSRLREFCQTHAIDAVFSSAFETAIGRQAGLRLAEALGNRDRAMGYGTTHWFDTAEIHDVEQQWQTL